MIGLDTNVLLRFLAQDDDIQSPKANSVISSLTQVNPGWISVASVLELVWVSISSFGAGRNEVCEVLDRLAGIENLVIENVDAVIWASDLYRRGNADFADCLIASLGRVAGCTKMLTFDRAAAKSAGMTLVG